MCDRLLQRVLLAGISGLLTATSAQSATDIPKTQLNCTRQLISGAFIADPAAAWDEDVSFSRGYKLDPSGTVTLYIVGDKIKLTRDSLPSLFRTRNLPNTKVQSVVFDAREIDLDMPVVFDTTTVTIYAQTVRVGPRASIVLTQPPSKVDGVAIVADTIDFSHAPKHPLVFVTRAADWPITSKRLVTVVANSVRLRDAQTLTGDQTLLARQLTLDENYAEFAQPGDSTKAYSVDIGTPNARDQVAGYMHNTMLWPLETAEKIARQFSAAPFDANNKRLLATKITALYEALPPGSHAVARSVLARTSHSMGANVDSLGFYEYYVPRISFGQTLNDFKALQGTTLTALEAWDKELVAAQNGSNLSSVVGSLDADVGTLKSALSKEQNWIDAAINELVIDENTIISLSQSVDRYEAEIKAEIEDEKKKQETNKNIKIGTQVVVLAASLTPVSAPVAIAIGTAAGVAGNQILQFNEGRSPDLAGAVTSIPEAMGQAREFQKKTSALTKQWSVVKTKFAAYNTPAAPAPSAPPAAAPPPNGTAVVGENPASPKEEFGTAVGDFADSLISVLNSVKSPEPTVTRQSDKELNNAGLQQKLHAIGDIRNSEAAVFSRLDALRKEVLLKQDRVAQLESQRLQLTQIDVQNDRDRALRQSLGWAIRQDLIRQLAYNAVVVSRAYKYHTLQDVSGPVNEETFSSGYRLSGSIEQSADSTSDFFRSQARTTLQASLDTQRQQLANDLKAYVEALQTGYKKYRDGIARHSVHSPEYTLSCRGLKRTDPRCIFLTAVNDEIANQIASHDTNRRPIAIPIPLQIKRTFRSQPQKLLDIAVSVEYEDPSLASDKSVEFSVDHPFFGKLWGAELSDCWLADMRRYDALENLQPYVTTCNNTTPCTHDAVKLTEDFLAEDASHAPLPVDTTYFLVPSVQDRGAESRIPLLKTIRIKVWTVE